MSKNLIYVTGAFEGVFYTLQKSPISIGEKIPEGGLHHVRIFQGSLNQVAKLDHFLPEEHLNRDGMLLHNITNIQLNPGSKSVVKEKLIYDFDQVVIKDVYVENSWELNDKTYGILKGTLVGKLKNQSPISGSNDLIPPIDPSRPIVENTPPPPIDNGNVEKPPFFRDENGCLPRIWNVLKWLLLLLLLWFILTEIRSCLKDSSALDDCSKLVDSLNKQNDDLRKKLKVVEEEKLAMDSLQAEIIERRKREEGRVGKVTVSLIWNTTDDLDLAIEDPQGQNLWYKSENYSYGELDIDQNRGAENEPLTQYPIENIILDNPIPGRYYVKVNFYTKRSNLSEIPYYLEVNIGGKVYKLEQSVYQASKQEVEDWQIVYQFNYPKANN